MRKKLLGMIVTLLVAVMAFGTVGAMAKEGTVVDGVYKASDPNSLFGVAADFGVFAETINMQGDTECNIACNKLVHHNGIKPNTNGYMYIKEYVEGAEWFGHSDKFRNLLDDYSGVKVYVGSNYKIENQGKDWYLSSGSKRKKITLNDGGYFANENADVPFIDVTKELDSLTELALELYTKAQNGAKFDLKDQNNRKLICSSENSVVNVSYKEFANYVVNPWYPAGNGIQQRPLYVKGMENTNNSVIVNITGADEFDSVVVPNQLYIDGKDPENNAKYASRIIWNFGDYSGEISIPALFGGIILAPRATVKLDAGNHVGSIIAKTFENGAEVHQIPGTFKGQSKVKVTIRVLDGTCCDNPDIMTERLLQGVEFSLYKKNGRKYRKVSNSETETDANALASWTIKEAGEYYIKETTTIPGYVKSPSRCVFSVTKNSDGTLKIEPKSGAKDGNGEVKYTKLADDGTSVEYKFRKYGDSLYMAAYIPGENDTYTLVSSQYKFKVNGKEAKFQEGLEDENGEAYNIYESHIEKAGRYEVAIQKNGETEIKVVDAYLLPVGSYIFFEGDFVDLDAVKSELGDYNIAKVTKSVQNYINSLRNEDFDLMTDGCVFFEVQEISETAAQNDGPEA